MGSDYLHGAQRTGSEKRNEGVIGKRGQKRGQV